MTDLRYPAGPLQFPEEFTPALRLAWIDEIRRAPAGYRAAVAGMTQQQLDTPYRPGGWTVRQVVHHVADSHANSYIRFRLALTEDEPLIKPYHEALWAELPDAKSAPVELSLDLIDSLHARWVLLLETLAPSHLARTFRHPERGLMSLDKNLALYAWHCRHHLAHIALVGNA